MELAPLGMSKFAMTFVRRKLTGPRSKKEKEDIRERMAACLKVIETDTHNAMQCIGTERDAATKSIFKEYERSWGEEVEGLFANILTWTNDANEAEVEEMKERMREAIRATKIHEAEEKATRMRPEYEEEIEKLKVHLNTRVIEFDLFFMALANFPADTDHDREDDEEDEAMDDAF